jgi:hypothetical protein
MKYKTKKYQQQTAVWCASVMLSALLLFSPKVAAWCEYAGCDSFGGGSCPHPCDMYTQTDWTEDYWCIQYNTTWCMFGYCYWKDREPCGDPECPCEFVCWNNMIAMCM